MSFTLLFSSYLFHFFPLPCSHIFSWCLLSLAAERVAMLRKYWFLARLLFLLFSPTLLCYPSPSSSLLLEASEDLGWTMTNLLDFQLLLLWFLASLFFYVCAFLWFWPWDQVLTSQSGVSLKALSVTEELWVGCVLAWGEILSNFTSLNSSQHPSKQQRPMFRRMACCRPLRWQLIPPDKTQIL